MTSCPQPPKGASVEPSEPAYTAEDFSLLRMDLSDGIDELIEQTIKRMFCARRGHAIHMDQCGKPEHDYCHACGESFPGKAVERRESGARAGR